jgi:hypothetical protein
MVVSKIRVPLRRFSVVNSENTTARHNLTPLKKKRLSAPRPSRTLPRNPPNSHLLAHPRVSHYQMDLTGMLSLMRERTPPLGAALGKDRNHQKYIVTLKVMTVTGIATAK